MFEDRMAGHIWGGATETMMHPAVAGLLLLAVVLIFILDRRQAFTIFVLAVLLIPLSQRGVVMGLNFMAMRILILAVWARMFFRMELRPIRLNVVDGIFLLWVFSSVLSFVLLWQTWGALVNRMGFLLDAAGIYFLCRFLFTDILEMNAAVRSFAVFAVVLAVVMTLEQITGRNMYAFLGGADEFVELREGRFRSKGPFAHAILAGTFGAALFPMLFSLWRRPELRTSFLIVGMAACVMIVVTSASSGPVLAFVAGVIALNMWPLRGHLGKLKWGIIISIVALHLIMKAPVWALISRVGIIAGSSSYHRFYLVDQFIKRFDEWWLFGTRSTDHWGWMMWDAINQFVAEGIRGGLSTFILFLLLLIFCYRTIGAKIDESAGNRTAQLTFWAIGCALFAHTVSFFGIAYFDQIILLWYFLLAMIAGMTDVPASAVAPAPSVAATRPKARLLRPREMGT